MEKTSLLIACLSIICAANLRAQISRFDNNDEKWYANIDAVGNEVHFDATEGNPPPSIYAIDSNTGLPWYFVAPDCFLGNRAYAYGDTLKYDLLTYDLGNTNYTNDLRITGFNGMELVHNHGFNPILGKWTTFKTRLLESEWHINNGNGPNPTQAEFLLVLSNIAVFEIRGEYKTGVDQAWLDNVWMGNVPDTVMYAEICQGDVFQVGDYSHSAPGIFLDELEDKNKCDSLLVLLELKVNPRDFEVLDLETCPGQPVSLPDGSSTSAPGIYPFTFKNAKGCDSTVVVDLKNVTTFTTTLKSTVCEGETFVLPDGTTTTWAGFYQFKFTSSFGCDSNVVLELKTAPHAATSSSSSICAGEFLLAPDGSLLSSPGNYTFKLQTVFGCDSTVSLELQVLDTAWSGSSAAVCRGDFFAMPDGSLNNLEGRHEFHFPAKNGCDSTVVVDLEILDTSLIVKRLDRCDGQFFTFPDGSKTNVSGEHFFHFQKTTGCDSTLFFELKFHPVFDTLIEVLLPEGEPFEMPDGSVVRDTTFEAFYNFPTGFGCDSTVVYRVDYVFYRVYIPNVISPNADSNNDFFTIYTNEDGQNIRTLNIYDRWGEHIFAGKNFAPNVDNLGWDGTFRGKDVLPGVFAWWAEVEFVDGRVFFFKGDVTVVR